MHSFKHYIFYSFLLLSKTLTAQTIDFESHMFSRAIFHNRTNTNVDICVFARCGSLAYNTTEHIVPCDQIFFLLA